MVIRRILENVCFCADFPEWIGTKFLTMNECKIFMKTAIKSLSLFIGSIGRF